MDKIIQYGQQDLGRYQKDVTEQVNVKYMIVLYGVNDISLQLKRTSIGSY